MIEKEKGFREFYQNQSTPQKRKITTITLKKNQYNTQLKDVFSKNKIEGVFVSTSKAHEVADFLNKENIKYLKLIGFDLISKNIEHLKCGNIQFLINQNPRKQTELAISTLCNHLLFNKPIKKANLFPLDIITRSNLSYFNISESE
jgi:LacI family transcriptional regulator